MVSSVFVLDLKGKTLIYRTYRGDVPVSAADRFMPLVAEQEEKELPALPVMTENGINYIHMRHNDLYLLALSRGNSNAMMAMVFLQKLVQVLTEYFGTLEEESIRDNFVVIYELLDEIMDYGVPQITETNILKEYITQESFMLEKQSIRPPMAVTNAVSWRSEGIKYKKNEVFLDVIESINLLANPNGDVLRSEIMGVIKIKSCLSGMPELRLGLNDKVVIDARLAAASGATSPSPPASGSSTGGAAAGGGTAPRPRTIEMEDIKFHQCVRLSRFESDRTISFIPPDGEFELMSYRLNTQVKPLIWCETLTEMHSGRVEYLVKAKSQFKRRSTANHVEITVPVPEDCDSPRFQCSVGTVEYLPEKAAFVWTIRQFPGGQEATIRAHFGRPTIKSEEPEQRKPISIVFEIPYYTTSGIQVRYLKITERSGYIGSPWVRYLTLNGDYHIRTNEPVGTSRLTPI
ncbi:clathrin adaptor, mu subunit [Ramicandelaber brevisporus]|nr:clathrin adaptor, mu subunit [Ramicandelaber brevisporus]